MIMSAVPMGLTGAAIILRLFNVGVSLPVYVGFMILCGLIVNVNVVLIYTINRLIRQGVPLEQAVVEGTEMRFRPVVMTVLTTVFASVPMLLDRGAGASVWSPFALTLAAGIIFGGTISLIMTPVLYRNLERLKIRMRGVRNR
jgi:cobalt-zinc-cadmium resistance protein CzcA